MTIKERMIRVLRALRIRSPLHFGSKKLHRMLYSLKPENENLSCLIANGFFKYEAQIESKVIDDWMARYNIDTDLITPSDGNCIIPFFNHEVFKLLTDSSFSRLLTLYFNAMYGCKPILQCTPSLVMTFPSIEQHEFKAGAHNFPANWHSDYVSEFTVHIPLVDITENNSHTLYAENTHTAFLNTPPEGPMNKTIVPSFAKKGDVVMIDVDGWHTGRLEGVNPRIMIQFKFTKGNDLLGVPSVRPSDKLIRQVERTKRCIRNYNTLVETLTEDYDYIKSNDFSGTPLAIISDSVAIYDSYTTPQQT